MRLYVANPTDQSQLICYRIDFDADGKQKDTNRRFQPARQQEIKPGTQAQLGGDMHKAQIDDIVGQLRVYGMVYVSEVGKVGATKIPYIYNVDAHVPADVMRRVQFHNKGVMTEDGRDRRARAAVATNELVQHTVQNQFLEQGIPTQPADTTLVSFEQEEQTEHGEKKIEEGYEVVPEGKRGPRSGKVAAKKRK